jgi:hypothetical protein
MYYKVSFLSFLTYVILINFVRVQQRGDSDTIYMDLIILKKVATKCSV